MSAVFGCSLARGDSRGIAEIVSHDVLHAARSVVERFWADLLMTLEKVAALIQCHRVGEHSANVMQLYTRSSDQIVADPQSKFAANEDVVTEQEIEMFVNRTGQRIFDGDNRRSHAVVLKAREDFYGAWAGHDRTSGKHA